MAQREDLCRTYHYVAEGAITQFAAVVKGTSDEQVTLPGGADVTGFVGIAQHAAASGERVLVAEPPSISKAIAGAAITGGVPVSINGTSGKVKAAAPASGANTFVIGHAETTVTTDGDHVYLQLGKSVMQGA